jgi:hypothetical protein
MSKNIFSDGIVSDKASIYFSLGIAFFERMRAEDQLALFVKDKGLPGYITLDIGVNHHAINEETKNADVSQEYDPPLERAMDTISDHSSILADFLIKHPHLEYSCID